MKRLSAQEATDIAVLTQMSQDQGMFMDGMLKTVRHLNQSTGGLLEDGNWEFFSNKLWKVAGKNPF